MGLVKKSIHICHMLKYSINFYQVSLKVKREEMKMNFINSDELDLIYFDIYINFFKCPSKKKFDLLENNRNILID